MHSAHLANILPAYWFRRRRVIRLQRREASHASSLTRASSVASIGFLRGSKLGVERFVPNCTARGATTRVRGLPTVRSPAKWTAAEGGRDLAASTARLLQATCVAVPSSVELVIVDGHLYSASTRIATQKCLV